MSPPHVDVAQVEQDVFAQAANNALVADLRSALSSGERAYELVPGLLDEVMETRAWLDRRDQNGIRHTFESEAFAEFISAPAPRGLAVSPDTFEKYIGDDPALRAAFDAAIHRGRGGLNNPSGINGLRDGEVNDTNGIIEPSEPPAKRQTIQGNTAGYAARRLSKARPDLFERVLAGEMTCHAAMIEAGFRTRTITLPVDLEQAIPILLRTFTVEQIETLLARATERE